MTFDSKGELLITIMSSLAQEESRSISENVTWGQRKRFADGKVKMPYKRFLGYEKGEDDTPRVVEAEAKIVRLIYRLFLDGKTACGICKHLEKMGIPTPSNGTKWSQSTVMSILQNEKYKGDALLQKKFTVDFLQKKMKTNEGEVPQYYVEGSHEAIIEADEWEMVQTEIKRRNALGRRYSGNSIFSTRLICADCGDFYGSKVWHSNDRYRKVIWRCNSKFTGHSKCTTPTLEDSTIKEKFMVAYNRFLPAKEHIIEDCEFIREQLTDPGELDREIARLTEELTVIAELVKKAIKDNADSEQSQEEYEAKYNALVKRYEKTNASLQKAEASKAKRMARDTELRLFISSLKKQGEIMLEWDDTLWRTLVECGKVHQDGSITFRFKDGTEITVE